jgi:hypothetical protein
MNESFKQVSRSLLRLRLAMETYAAGGSPDHLATVRSRIEHELQLVERELTLLGPTLDAGLQVDASTAQQLVADFDGFLRYELQVARLEVRSTTELKKFTLAAHSLQDNRSSTSILPGAKLSERLRTLVREETVHAIKDIDGARGKSRKAKKSEKDTRLFRYSLGTLGAAMIVADIGASIATSGMAVPVAIVSMTLGTGAVGSLAHNDPSVLKGAIRASRARKKQKKS